MLATLRAQVATAESRVRPGDYPVAPALASLLPDRGLRPGAVYSLGSAGALLLALLAEPSAEGHWCGVVGIPEFGAEAAQLAGVNLDRLVLVPEPGEAWLGVVAALAEVLPVLAVRPPGRVREGDAARLGSRLRDRGSVLLVHGDWPRAEARLELTDSHWAGLGAGFGHLSEREVLVRGLSRRLATDRVVRLLLPDDAGRLAAVRPLVPEPVVPEPLGLKAVG
jgi:hypothetical protein